MQVKETALDFINNSEEFVLLTDSCVIANAHPNVIVDMLLTACKNPVLKAALVIAAQRVMQEDALAMLN
jgi:hypothetical protein